MNRDELIAFLKKHYAPDRTRSRTVEQREYTWSWPGHLTSDGRPGYGFPVPTRAEAEAEGEPWMAIVSRPVGAKEWEHDE